MCFFCLFISLIIVNPRAFGYLILKYIQKIKIEKKRKEINECETLLKKLVYNSSEQVFDRIIRYP